MHTKLNLESAIEYFAVLKRMPWHPGAHMNVRHIDGSSMQKKSLGYWISSTDKE